MTDPLDGLKIRRTVSGGVPVKNRWRLVVTVCATVLLLLLLAFRFRPALIVETVTVSQVYPTQTFTLLNAAGYVVAQRKAAVAAKSTGRLEWLGVEEGSRVTEGEILARLESADTRSAIDVARSSLASAAANLSTARTELQDADRHLRRQKELIAQGIVPQSDYDIAEARYQRAQSSAKAFEAALRGAEASLKGAEIAHGYAEIRAPFSGVVLTKNADVGDIITPLGAAASAKAAVVTIADMGSLQVEVDVAEANVSRIKPGQPCEILLDALPDTRFSGSVHMIVPTADRSKASVMVKVRFSSADRRILPEMSAKVAFLEREPRSGEQTPKIAIPKSSLLDLAGRNTVYTFSDGKASAREVEVGSPIGDMLEIKRGISAGDKLIISPLSKLTNGMRVKIAEK